jgi:hypothetical protein
LRVEDNGGPTGNYTPLVPPDSSSLSILGGASVILGSYSLLQISFIGGLLTNRLKVAIAP